MNKTKAALQDSIYQHLTFSLAKRWEESNGRDLFHALALAVRDRLVERMLATERQYQRQDSKRLYYLSIEFLIGRSLANNLHNLELYEICRQALEEMGLDLDQVLEQENDAALGNGGLGRLAACFLDSLATLALPGYLQPAIWTRKAVLNVARMGKFSSDRTISEYARDVWGLKTSPSETLGRE